MKTKLKFIPLLILLIIITLSIGYSAFNKNLIVSDIGAEVRIKADIRISGISIDNTNNVTSYYENYDVHSVSSKVQLPSTNSEITYKISVTNFESANMGIYTINGLPNNLEYTLSNYQLKDKICDTNNNCNLGITKEFYITIKYTENGYNEENVDYNINLDFDFRQIYTISYTLNGGTNPDKQKSEFIDGEEIDILSPTKNNSIFDGWYEEQDFSGNKVSVISNRHNDIELYAKWNYIIYFQLPPDWKGTNVNIYLYNGDKVNASWPGKNTTLINSELKIYSYTLSEEEIDAYEKIIFTNIGSSTEKSARQTIDLEYTPNLIGKIFVPELYSSDNETRVFSTEYNSIAPNLYLWFRNASGNDTPCGSWPGTQMTDRISGNGYQAIINRNNCNMMIFNVNGIQTEDLQVTAYQDLTYQIISWKNQKITRFYYLGSWHNYEDWLDSEYDVWKQGDYISFQQAKEKFGY